MKINRGCRPGAGILALCVLLAIASPRSVAQNQAPRITTTELNGEWRFAIDPTDQGEADRWFAPDLDDRRWDRVEVPHCWPLDPRYQYTGRAWYRRTFPTLDALGDGHARIEFGAVFARARVWLNGTSLGAHEGGYTPFGFDVTRVLAAGQPNVLVLEVDNSWSTTTMPGARPGTEPTARVYPWWDYGGIIRPVTLVVSPAVYVQKQRVTAVPDLTAGTAAFEATTWVRNTTTRPAISRLRLTLIRLDGDREVPLTVPAASLEGTGTTAAGATMPIALRATLPREVVRLWGLDHPTLYRVRTELTTESGVDLHASTFGIRRFEARGTELQLNGRPVRLGGGNRPSDDPKFGLLEPIEVVERDVKLMKAAGMELQRIIHYAPPPALLDLSDRLGLLIVGEPGNWNLQPTQLEDAGMRADFENQMRELVERDWNHPSVIAWSVGNEYASDTPAGVRWTTDMVALARKLDPSRLVTFASYRAFRPDLPHPEDEGSHVVDFVSINTYAAPARLGEVLDLVHQRYPQKPIVISEFGLRADKAESDDDRRRYFREAIDVIRQRPFIAGASVWTFQDYRSRYPDTAPNGYRPWGVVDHLRAPRDAYHVVANEFAAARVVAAPMSRTTGRLVAHVVVEARPDFPARSLSDLVLQIRAGSAGAPLAARPLPDLGPGQRVEVVLEIAADPASGTAAVQIVRPDGSVMHHFELVESTTSPGAASR